MPTKENLDHATEKNTELPRGTVVKLFIGLPNANENQQTPIDKEKRGVSMDIIREQGREREKKEQHFSYHAGQSERQKQFWTVLKKKLRHGGRSQHKD